jgi:hypothetical protein
MDAANKPAYIVYVSDSRPEGRASEVRYYRTQSAARKRFDELNRTLVRTGHNAVMLGRRCSQTGIYLNVFSA